MNLIETANVLALAQAFDNRTVGEVNVRAWYAVLGDLAAEDVVKAVEAHYSTETAWIMPAHVVAFVKDLDRIRAAAATPWAPGQYGVPKDQALPELPGGAARLTAADVSPEVLDLLSQLRAKLPDAPRERLFPREAEWDRQQRAFTRQWAAEPPRQDVVEAARDMCRAEGPHDSGAHISICPDVVPEPHVHRASCHGAIGELLCGFTA